MEADLLGSGNGDAAAVALRHALAERGMAPQHAQDLLKAFRLDATKLRYRDWDDLMGYCAYSAMPVGRFVLDVHGESRGTWPASDAICAALQIINHIQDCATTTAISTASIFRSMRLPRTALTSRRSARPRRRRNCAPASPA